MSLISYRISYELRASSFELVFRRPVFSSQLAARSSQLRCPAFNSQLAACSSQLRQFRQLLLLGDQS